ncbi:MAG: MBL fold metallo-hydrolase [Thermoanaerobaculia bacterium]
MRSTPSLLLAALILLPIGGCRHTLSGTKGCQAPAPDPSKVEVRYLGSGGIYLRWRDDAILLGPSFSNPWFFRAGLGRVKPNGQRIDNANVEYQYVRAIFAGHSHYDHIADIPAVARKIPHSVPIYVNATGTRILAAEGLDVREIVAGKPPVEAGSIHVRAVASGHAPQICKWRHFPCVYAGGKVADDWKTAVTKRHLIAMRSGQPLAFVIELYDGEKVRYRIYYNDASPDSPLGQTTGDFDLAILTIAQWNWARDYPRDLLSVLRPRHVMISHWDNFFAEATQTSKAIPFLTTKSVRSFADIVETYVTRKDVGPVNHVCGAAEEKWTMPAPASTMLFKPREP